MGASGFLGCYVVVGTSGTRGGLGLENRIQMDGLQWVFLDLASGMSSGT